MEGVGNLDDLVLASAVLSQALGGELEPYARRYWNGDQELRVVLHDISKAASELLGRDLFGRLERPLARCGVHLRWPPARAPLLRRARSAPRAGWARSGRASG